MDKTYDPAKIETRWYERWERAGYFDSKVEPDADNYCIVIPPPNVTGSLHMGHAFQHTIMDALTRYHRMKGANTLWQPGTDHAGIATQMVVERKLAAEGQSRHDLGREAFIDKIWDWKAESGGNITRQMRRMGSSVDWKRERFTMDAGLSKAVTETFVRLYEEGLIYRGKRLVNWDPVLKTAVSDLEVESEEENGHLWHLRYPRTDGNGHVIVATTRPETMLGDAAVAVHPDDERYADLVGKTVKLPLTNREIPVIADDYVDPEFGTGCVKITPAHDFNDYEVGQRHDLQLLNIFDDDANINDEAPEAYRGLDRFAARKQIVADLEAAELLERIDDHKLMVPRGDRTGQVLEPYLTDQWFVKTEPLAKPAIEAVENGDIRFVPDNWKNTYFQWMRNIQDWCISRQLWWGHRIPAWYDDDGGIWVGRDEAEARAAWAQANPQADADGITPNLSQDDDVLDTWFSSALWPFSTLGWPDKTPEMAHFYPTNVLVTGFDIIFFWVARMIMFGLKFAGDVPFRDVYITGLIRDAEGQKQSKSKGNVIDPVDLIDGIDLEALVKKRTFGMMQPQKAKKIEKATRKDFPEGIPAFGTDAVRFTYAALASTGRDIRFDLARVAGYRNFCNKLWNASRYVLMNCEGQDTGVKTDTEIELSAADRWIISALQDVEAEVAKQLDAYRFDLAAQALYEFTWNEYCDWYLELSKPALQGDASNAEKRGTRRTLVRVLEAILRLAHPMMPFITEEIWQKVCPLAGTEGESISLAPWPKAQAAKHDPVAEADSAWLKGFILGIRRIRGEMDIAPSKPLPVLLEQAGDADRERVVRLEAVLKFLARTESITVLADADTAPESAMALLGSMRILVPMAGLIDKDAELARLDKQIAQTEGELNKARGKLANKNFIERAPEAVVKQEQQRLAGFETALKELSEQRTRIAALD